MRSTNLLVSLCLSLALSALSAGEAATTRACVQKYGKDLASTWEKFPADHQKTTRTQAFTDINASFTRELGRSTIPAGEKVQQIIKALLENLGKADELFRAEKMKLERSSYIRGCGQVFRKEIAAADDLREVRTTQKCYDLLVEAAEDARERFLLEKNKDQRAECYTAMQAMFTELMKNAKPPENVDPATQLDNNLREAKKRFPVTTQALKDKNGPLITLLQTAAQSVMKKATAR